MEFISEALSHYCETHSEKEPELLNALNRETHLKVLSPRMLSGHLQGRLLSFISKMKQPACVLEIGTYTGYSALCLAEGLAENGELFTIDPNEETNTLAQKYFDSSIYANKIKLMKGDAKNIIPRINKKFDLVFIDADKKNYPAYFDLIIEDVNKGGIIIADNVLWSGKVINEIDKMDPDTRIIHEFNNKVNADSRVTNLLLPVRDGLLIMLKN